MSSTKPREYHCVKCGKKGKWKLTIWTSGLGVRICDDCLKEELK
jgi:hypothetical protein